MSSDVTYLEAFMETLSTLPPEVRRNLDLMKDLDAASSKQAEELRRLQQEYLRDAEEKLMQLECAPMDDGVIFGVRAPNDADAVILPTSAELMQFTCNQEKYAQIQRLRSECLQKTDEKVAIAQQTYEMIDATVQRLDRDLQAMEKLLQARGDFDQKGIPQQPKPDDLVACQVSPGDEWILAKILQYDANTGMYKLADEDIESKNKVFHLPETQVIMCGVEKLSRGDSVFAVYPDTTSFYQATVVASRKTTTGAAASAGGGATNTTTSGGFVMVNFVDDADEFGITHDKPVPLQHVIHPPSSYYGN